LRHEKVYMKIDLHGAYNLVQICEGNKWRTTLQWHFKCVVWCLLALLMHLPSSTFDEWGISWILGWFCGLLHPWHLIFSKEMKDHEQHICVVLDNLREVWLYVKLEMCEFHQIKVELLGYISFEDGIHKGPQIFYTRWCVLTTWRRLPFSFYQFHFLKKIYAKINYKIFDTKLLTIVDTF
jgi:hypothetical protein